MCVDTCIIILCNPLKVTPYQHDIIIILLFIQMELEQRLLELCIDNIGDIQEFRYILSQPGVDPNIYYQVL